MERVLQSIIGGSVTGILNPCQVGNIIVVVALEDLLTAELTSL